MKVRKTVLFFSAGHVTIGCIVLLVSFANVGVNVHAKSKIDCKIDCDPYNIVRYAIPALAASILIICCGAEGLAFTKVPKDDSDHRYGTWTTFAVLCIVNIAVSIALIFTSIWHAALANAAHEPRFKPLIGMSAFIALLGIVELVLSGMSVALIWMVRGRTPE